MIMKGIINNTLRFKGDFNMNQQKWNTQEVQKDFEILSFFAPFVAVERKIDGKRGTMRFDDYPRYYYDFKAR